MKLSNNQSGAKKSHGFIDGYLGEKAALHDEAPQNFLFGSEAQTIRRIGVKCWRQDSKVNVKKVAKGVQDLQTVVKIEGKSKKN